jgi:NAD(P)-dependent dehydrogenase (short-subunit alcohol dehydrogenase family)
MNTPPSPARVALVTGAARGIGLAIARRFLREGWRVALLDIDTVTLAATEAALADPARVLALPADVADAAQVARAVAALGQRFGRLDALVNNAGIAVFKPILETSAAEWQRVLDVNLGGAFHCTQAAAPLMLQGGGGAVVNIASISGLRASTLRVAYGTSKAALIHLTKQQAAELGTVGIRVNAVAPGPVETAMARQVHTPAIRADYHDTIPLARYGAEDEIAAAVWFLCTPEAAYVNGQTLAVDGGFDATGIGPVQRRARHAASAAAASNGLVVSTPTTAAASSPPSGSCTRDSCSSTATSASEASPRRCSTRWRRTSGAARQSTIANGSPRPAASAAASSRCARRR